MRPPTFLRVSPADIGRVGALGACILALVRYVTSLSGEINGRRMVDGEMWWRASAPDIAEALGNGLSPRTVSGTVKQLTDIGALTAIPTQDFYGDRAKAYRASDLPSAISDIGSDLPSADIADRSADIAEHVGRIRHTTSADIADLPIPGELEDLSEGENARATPIKPLHVDVIPSRTDTPTSDSQRIGNSDAIVGQVVERDPDDPEPQPYCDRHMPSGTDAPCGPCANRRKAHERWTSRHPEPPKLRAYAELAAEERGRESLVRIEPRPEPPAWLAGPHGPRCRAHGHLEAAPPNCERCRDATVAAEGSA